MEPRKGLVQFTAALSFFPQLVAGPILRTRQILPQMHAIPTPTWEGIKHGFLLITVGLMKKTTADLLAVPVATAFDGTGPVSLVETWTGVLAFAGQIYGDFSGYSDMAIGLAILIGFKIPLNFRLPYFAVSPVDFWRRWHISLSTWLRDYLYFSLGGNRTGHRMRNIFITMLLGGLWHGAAWTFIAWGFFHGVIITATHYFSGIKAFASFNGSPSRGITLLKWLITFYLVMIGWVFFRAQDIGSAFSMLGDMHTISGLPAPASSAGLMFGLVVLAVALMHLLDRFVLNKADWFESKKWLFWPLLALAMGLCLLVGKPSQEFIYFQF
jgi:D-alanyl-lipoteichoic acid acyltransferase DltB (MBOAT superfamily)